LIVSADRWRGAANAAEAVMVTIAASAAHTMYFGNMLVSPMFDPTRPIGMSVHI
jgi:hypothetical protein